MHCISLLHVVPCLGCYKIAGWTTNGTTLKLAHPCPQRRMHGSSTHTIECSFIGKCALLFSHACLMFWCFLSRGLTSFGSRQISVTQVFVNLCCVIPSEPSDGQSEATLTMHRSTRRICQSGKHCFFRLLGQDWGHRNQ